MIDAPVPVKTPRLSASGEPLSGFGFALAAFLIWGLFPFYLKAVGHIPVMEVVAHRIVWSVPMALLILAWMGRLDELRAALANPKAVTIAMLTAVLISINWGTYVWAIANERGVQGALGYYINPLVNVVLGAVFLGERLNRLQAVAVACAVAAVAILTFRAGGLPWVSLVLAFSFGFYGFLKKTMPMGATPGFTLEAMLLAVIAVPYLLWLGSTGTAHFSVAPTLDTWLLLLAGPVTTIPLVCYATGARLLRYTTIGVLQYITPTMIFLIAIFAFGEPFTWVQLVAFCFIWAGLAIYSVSLFRKKNT